MIITKKHLSRRTFLRGTFGAAMALPLLDAMVPALTAQAQTAATHAVPVRRHLHAERRVSRTPGIRTTAGSDFEFKPVMQPLEAVPRSAGHGQQDEGAVGRVGPPRARARRSSTASARSARATARATPSARSSRRRRSTSTSPTRSPATRRCARSKSAPRTWAPPSAPATASPAPSSTRSSWRDDTSPLPVGINPRVTFERMFGETGSTEQRTARLKEKQSLLDSVIAGNGEAAAARSARPTARSSTSI